MLPLLVQAVELRHLRTARSAPGRPNIDEHDLALVIAQALGVPENVSGIEGRRSYVPHRQVSRLLRAGDAIVQRFQSETQRKNRDGKTNFPGQRKRMPAAVLYG